MKAPTIRNPFAAKPLPEQPDIEAAAEKLEISVEDLTAALPENFATFAQGGFSGGAGGRLATFFGEAAEKLGVEVQTLMDALGRPFDIEAAAKKLDVSVETLTEALPEQFTSRLGGTGGAQGGR